MKKNILIACLFLVAAIPVLAQKRSTDFEREHFFRVGFKAGVNINKINGMSYKDQFRYNYNLGGFMQFNFARKFGFQPEVNFVQSSAEQTNDFSDIYDDISLGGSQVKSKLNYLKVATLLNLNIGPTQRIKLQVGPQWGMLMHQNTDSVRTQDIFKKGDFSLVGGIMFQLPFINLGARFEQGMTNINAIDNRDKWTSQSWNVFLGFTF
jgi:hypothetical protein